MTVIRLNVARIAEPASDLLTNTAAAIDGAFVKAGERLGESASLTATIRETIAQLPAALETAEVDRADSDLIGLCGRLRELSAALANERTLIGAVAASIFDTAAPLAKLNRTVKTVGIVAVTARVTSASIDSGQIDMEVFNRELATLAQATSDNVKTFNVTIDDLRSTAQDMLDEAGTDSQDGLLSALADHIEQSLLGFRAERASAAEWAGSLQAPLTEALAAVGSGVMSLQAGDSVRQRLEHASVIMASVSDATLAPEQDERDWLARSGRALLATLIADATQDLDRCLEQIDGAMADIERTCEAVAARGRRQVSGSALSALAQEVAAALKALEAFCERQDGIDRSAEIVMAAVTELTATADAIGTIEAEMRLVSLNATIKCAQLGEKGRALNVIAQHLNEMTGETVAAVHEVVGSFKETKSLTQAYAQAKAFSGPGAMLKVYAAGQSAVEVLAGINGQLVAVADDLAATVATMGGHVRYAKSAFGGLHAATERMLDLVHELAAIPTSDDEIGPPPSPHCQSIVEGWRASYTMRSERDIHDALFIPSDPASQAEMAVEMF